MTFDVHALDVFLLVGSAVTPRHPGCSRLCRALAC